MQTIAGYEIPEYLERTKKTTETFAYVCLECGHQMNANNCGPWGIRKSIGLHKHATGHKKSLLLAFRRKAETEG